MRFFYLDEDRRIAVILRLSKVQIVKNEQGESVFKRPLWIGVMGRRRHEVDSHRTYQVYRQRYDVEHFFRFGKQKLLLDSSSSRRHTNAQKIY